jgi:hypothetical protein
MAGLEMTAGAKLMKDQKKESSDRRMSQVSEDAKAGA